MKKCLWMKKENSKCKKKKKRNEKKILETFYKNPDSLLNKFLLKVSKFVNKMFCYKTRDEETDHEIMM